MKSKIWWIILFLRGKLGLKYLFNIKKNKVIGDISLLKNSKITFKGTGNHLILGNNAKLDLVINFFGSNARIQLGDNAVCSGEFKLQDNSSIQIGVHSVCDGKLKLRNNGSLQIGDNSVCRGEFRLTAGCSIQIGTETTFNKECRIHADEGRTISLGNGCLLANVRFRTSDSHSIIDLSSGLRTNSAKDIIIGNQVWIAEDVKIYKGTLIGDGSVVGANSVVMNSSLPPNSLIVGAPAKVIRSNISWNTKLI